MPEPSNREICLMCHFASHCEKCCKTCDDTCNAKQYCQIGVVGQASRWESWLALAEEDNGLTHTKKLLKEYFSEHKTTNV